MSLFRTHVRLGTIVLAVLATSGLCNAQNASPAVPAAAPAAPNGAPVFDGPNLLPPDAAAAKAARTLVPYFVPATKSPAKPDKDGFLRRWLLLEPIDKPNRSNDVFTGTYVRATLGHEYYPNQFAALPRNGDVVKVGNQSLAWHALDTARFDVKLFRFAYGLNKQTYGVIFWAATVVNSPRDINVRLAVGSNSASMWKLNGEDVASLFDDRRMVMDDVVSKPLTLKKGRNVLWGAVINGPGLSDFCVRFVDDRGQPIKDVTVSTQ
jgi:hypothetical protein